MANKYQRFGLRADKNLQDVPNPTAALNNILEDLTISSNEKFTAADLLVIKDLKDTRVDVNKLSELNNILPAFTPVNGVDNQPALPFVTVKDQIENFKVIAGDPPFLSGGLGPTAFKYSADMLGARYNTSYNAGNQNHGASVPFSSPGANISVVEEVRDDPQNVDLKRGPLDFWQTGEFQQSSKLHPSFTDQFGSVIWEGWTSISGFEIRTNGCFIVEQDVFGLGEWETLAVVPYYRTRWPTSQYSISITASGGSTTITIANAGQPPYQIFERMRVYFEDTSGNLISNDGNLIERVETVGNDRVITIAEELTPGSINAVHFGFNPDTDLYVADGLSFDQRYTGLYTRLKIAWFYPKLDSGLVGFNNSGLDNKQFDMRFSPNDLIEYWYFYPENPNLPNAKKYSYEQFLTERVSDNVKDAYEDIVSSEPMIFSYAPPTSFAAITPPFNITNRNQLDFSQTNIPSKRLIVSTGYEFKEALDQGDYLLYRDSANTVTAAQVYRFDDTPQHIYVNPNPDSEYGGLPSSAGAMTAIKKEGLVGVYGFDAVASDAVGTYVILRAENSNSIKGQQFSQYNIAKDMIVFFYSLPSGGVQASGVPHVIRRMRDYQEVSGNIIVSFYVEPLIPGQAMVSNTSTDGVITVYASKGLHDNSSPQQCLGVLAAECSASAIIGEIVDEVDGEGQVIGQVDERQLTITITQTAASLGLEVGDYVQFGSDPSLDAYSSVYVPDNTQIASISGSTLTLEQGNVGDFAVPVNSTVVFIKSSNYVQSVPKEFCVVPLNTAPPFVSTDTGLETPTTPTGFGLEATDIEFRNMTITTTGAISQTFSIEADGFLPIYYGDTKLKLLTSSVG